MQKNSTSKKSNGIIMKDKNIVMNGKIETFKISKSKS